MAVKVFRLDITPEQAHALAAELTRVTEAGLFHPSIVEPVAAGVEGSVAYGGEEYVAAESLDVAMRHYAPASLDTVLPFITQLAGAIDFARAAGVGHGALHPRDIFVTPDEARATGFGVVESLERLGLRAPIRRPYTAPERIAGKSWGTPADVFSLAAIAYELLTGRRPAGLGAEIARIATGSTSAAVDGVHAVFVRALDEDPTARYQTALAFAAALEEAARAMPASARASHIAAAASTSAAVGAPAGPMPSAVAPDAIPDVDVDDIAAERSEDEAFHQLTLDEAEDEAAREAALPGDDFGDDEVEADTDRFLIDVAGQAADDFKTGSPARGYDLLDDDEPVVQAPRNEAQPADRLRDRDDEPIEPSYSAPRHPMLAQPSLASASVPPERSRSSGAVAALLLLGLLAGLAAGYAIWGRSGITPATVAEGAAAPAQTAATGKEFSEQAVTPRQTPAPTAQTGTGASPQSTGSSGSATAPLADAPPPPSKPAPVRAPTGRVVVRSTPAGAGVTINGDWRGRTLLTLTDLPLASYNVRVVQPGFIPATSTVALTAGEPSRTVAFRLRLQPGANAAAQRREPARAESAASSSFTGSIYVDSRPRGAQVSIDGKPVGVTPLRIPDVRIGTRIVRLELPDHRIWSSTARVTAGQESRVTGSLERIQ